jgi:hypothetical protein
VGSEVKVRDKEKEKEKRVKKQYFYPKKKDRPEWQWDHQHVRRAWCEEEDAMLVARLPPPRSNWGKVLGDFPGRSARACARRWGELQREFPHLRRWDREEDERLLELWESGETPYKISEQVPERTPIQIAMRLNELGQVEALSHVDRPWASVQEWRLWKARMRCDREGIDPDWDWISKEVGGSASMCEERWYKAVGPGESYRGHRVKVWSQDEDQVLIAGASLPRSELVSMLRNKSDQAVVWRLHALRRRGLIPELEDDRTVVGACTSNRGKHLEKPSLEDKDLVSKVAEDDADENVPDDGGGGGGKDDDGDDDGDMGNDEGEEDENENEDYNDASEEE